MVPFSEKTVQCAAMQMVSTGRTLKMQVGHYSDFLYKGTLSLNKIKRDRWYPFPGKRCIARLCKWSKIKERPKLQVVHPSDFLRTVFP